MGKIKLVNWAVHVFAAICMALSKDRRLKTNILFFLIFPVGKNSLLIIRGKNPMEF